MKCTVNIGKTVTYKGINYYAGNVIEDMEDALIKAHADNKDVTIINQAPAIEKPKKEAKKCLSVEEK